MKKQGIGLLVLILFGCLFGSIVAMKLARKTEENESLSSDKMPPIVTFVDDDATVLKAIGRTLGLNGFNNIIAKGDSRHLMSFLEETDVSMVLLDITMPHIRGDALLEEIVARHPHLPVVMATATDDINTVVDCMKKGAFDYINKPFDYEEFLTVVKKAIGQYQLKREVEDLRQTVHERYSFMNIISHVIFSL